MKYSTLAALFRTLALVPDLFPLIQLLEPLWRQLLGLLQAYRSAAITPQATYQLETDVQAALREQGRVIVGWLYQQAEPAEPERNPHRLAWEGEVYRRRRRHPNTIATLFGKVVLWRYLYEPLEPGERCLHPLEMRLGIEAGCATPALAERVGQWSAQQPQRTVQALLKRDHAVAWSAATLRKVTQRVSHGLAAFRHEAQVDKVVELLRRAFASRGRHRPVLAVGRDGIFVPLREKVAQEYCEGAVATVAVLDRRGKRLGTVYLGRMPEAKQVTLSAQLTALLQAVLARWDGPRPRLAYVTDAGWQPTDYFQRVLRRMEDPRRPGQRLHWERILDFYHACTYIHQLADALFGGNGAGWSRRMCKLLKQPHGITRLLQSASYHYNQAELSAARVKAYDEAYRYLRKRRRFMDYSCYRREGLPLGSGVTEAACKTVFTQRLKQSGMGWKIKSGQVIVDLRVIWLSGIWPEVYARHLSSKPMPSKDSLQGTTENIEEEAA
jgi:hypothetical protein